MAKSLKDKRLGKYRLLKLLGRGGMAEVYLAEHVVLQSQVAVKVLPADLSRDPEMVDRFLREAKNAARLRHPHIIRIHDVGQQEGVNYFVMDLLEGKRLSQLIAEGPGLPEKELVLVSRQVLSALDEAHQKGIVHRDLKPDNIIIDERGNALVTDFGIAKAAADTRLTAVGSFVGTVHYASPEQARGRNVDARSDVYSWGVVMYEMAVGHPPFAGEETSGVLYQHVHELPQPPNQAAPGLNPGLSALILKALEKRPEDRYGSAGDMLAALERITDAYADGRKPVLPATRAERDRAKVLMKDAQEQLKRAQWLAAQALAEKALKLDPDSIEARQLMERVSHQLARQQRIDKLTSEAKALEEKGRYRQAVARITELAGVSRDKEATLAWLQKVQGKLDQSSALDNSLQKARALMVAGEYRAARDLLSELMSQNPQVPEVASELGRAQQGLKALKLVEQARAKLDQDQAVGAEELLKQAAQMAPGLDEPGRALAEVRSRLSRERRAKALSDQAEILLEEKQAVRALELLDEALALEPKLTRARDMRRQARHMMAVRVSSAGEGDTVATPVVSPEEIEPKVDTDLPMAVQPEPPAKVKPGKKPSQPLLLTVRTKQGLAIGGGLGVLLVAVLLLGAAWYVGFGPGRQWVTRLTGVPSGPSATVKRVNQLQEHLDKGHKLAAAGKLREAEKAFQAALVLSPQNQEAKKGLAQITERRQAASKAKKLARLLESGAQRLASGDLPGAQRDFTAAQRLDPSSRDAAEGLAAVESQRQEIKDRRRRRRKARIASLLKRAKRLTARSELVGAAQAYRAVLNLEPDNRQATEGLGEVQALREARAEEQRKALAKARRLRTLLAAARRKMLSGDLEGARLDYHAVLDIEPHSQEANEGLRQVMRRLGELRSQKVSDYLRQAKAQIGQSRLDQAARSFQAVLALEPDNRQAREGLRQIKDILDRRRAAGLVEQGEQAARQARFARAAILWRQALDLVPGYQPALSKLAGLDRRRQEHQRQVAQGKAEAALEQALVLMRQGQHQKAATRLRAYLNQFPEDKQAKRLLVLAEQKTLSKADAGGLVVGCLPPAKVYVDDKEVGRTPLVLKGVSPGLRLIRVEGYGATASRKVRVRAGEVTKVRFKLRGAVLRVSSRPQADLFINGQRVGRTPLKLDRLALGTHRVVARRPGYREAEKQVTLHFGNDLHLKMELQKRQEGGS